MHRLCVLKLIERENWFKSNIMRIFDYYAALCSLVVQLCGIMRLQAIMLHKGEIMRYYAGKI